MYKNTLASQTWKGRRRPVNPAHHRVGEPRVINHWIFTGFNNAEKLIRGGQAPDTGAAQVAGVDGVFEAYAVGAGINFGLRRGNIYRSVKLL